MTAVAIAGLGKMGLSHLAILKPHPDVDVVGVCDAGSYVLDVLRKHTGAETYSDYEQMLDRARPDAVLIATPSHLHEPMVRAAVVRNIHVFCEKPLFLDPVHGVELTRMATERGLVTQVGYHNRYVEAFREVKRLLDSGAIGTVTDALAVAYGPVVL
jgi:predicted dehydrogenase